LYHFYRLLLNVVFSIAVSAADFPWENGL
jgi:hypothetical protein